MQSSALRPAVRAPDGCDEIVSPRPPLGERIHGLGPAGEAAARAKYLTVADRLLMAKVQVKGQIISLNPR